MVTLAVIIFLIIVGNDVQTDRQTNWVYCYTLVQLCGRGCGRDE